MRIFITGGNGQVAYEIVHLAQQKKHRILAPSRDVLDITDSKAVTRAVQEFHPDVVINAAAYTRVDQAEKEQAEAYAVNCEGAKNLAIVCAEIERPLLHLSTDYVFDGKKTHPYLETDPIAPVNLYGDSKWQGEEAIREQCEQHIILRTSAVFGSHGVNFVKTILRLASEREELRIVADQITCPTPASAIAETLLKLATFSRWGTYHYCGSVAVSWYDFAKKIIQLAENSYTLKIKKLTAISSADYSTPAKRPDYSVLDCHKLEKITGIKSPDWEKGLTDVLRALSTA